MQTEIIVNIDNKTKEFAERYANSKGFSVSEMIEYFLKSIIWNENFASDISINTRKKEENKWSELEDFLLKNRFDLPKDYSFNRNELYDR